MIDQYINLKETKVMFKKWLSLFLVGFIFLAGCSNANTKEGASEAGDKTVVTFWHSMSGVPQETLHQQ